MRGLEGWNGRRGTNPFSWAVYDQLPTVVRLAIAHSPGMLGSHRAFNNWISGMSPAAVAAEERRVGEAVAREILRDEYPPGHPSLFECGQ